MRAVDIIHEKSHFDQHLISYEEIFDATKVWNIHRKGSTLLLPKVLICSHNSFTYMQFSWVFKTTFTVTEHFRQWIAKAWCLFLLKRSFWHDRFSEEMTFLSEGSLTVDWSEIVAAAEAAQRQLSKYWAACDGLICYV